MFCQNCGYQVVEGSAFCQRCGAKLIKDKTVPQQAVSQQTVPQQTVAQQQIPVSDAQSSVNGSVGVYGTAMESKSDYVLLKMLIGKNVDYYLKQFDKINRGEKSFNWCALFFAPFLLLYRKQFPIFAKLYLPVYALLFIQMLAVGYVTASFRIELIPVISIFGMITAVYALAISIYCGRGFNKQYQKQLNNTIVAKQLQAADENTIKKLKPSAIIPVLFIILGGIFSCVLSLLISAIAVNSLFNDIDTSGVSDEYHVEDIVLNQSYANQAEGFSFQYPSDWTVMEGAELYDATFDADAVACVYAPEGFGSSSNIFVHKMQADYDLFDYTMADFERELLPIFDEVTVTDLSNVNIDGIPAIELGLKINTETGTSIIVQYYYIVGNYTYIITGTVRQSAIDSDKLVVDNIMDSYTITAASASDGNQLSTANSYKDVISYQGISIGYLLGTTGDVINLLGDSPLNDEYKLRYGDIEFYHENGVITSLESIDPSLFEANGIPLNKNREGLAQIFGEPTEEGNSGGGYFMSYQLPDCSIFFDLGEPESEVWRISISSSEVSEPFSGEILYNGQPLEDLLGSESEVLYDIFGVPTGGTPVTGQVLYGATEYYTYDDIMFMFSNQGTIFNITVNADAVEVNGETLQQNREGIINLLGSPWVEEQLPEDESGEGLGGYYAMEYNVYDGGVITTTTFKLPDIDGIANQVIFNQYIEGAW